jgi:signal transduction histidine kinase
MRVFPRSPFYAVLGALRPLRSLQWQIAASYAAMAALLCTAIGLVIMQVLSQNLREQDRADVTNRAVIAADLIYRSLDSPQGPELSVVLDEASQYAQARVCAYAANNALLGCSTAGLVTLSNDTPAPAPDTQVSSPATQIAPVTGLSNGQSSIFGYVILSDPLTYRQATENSTREAIFRISVIATAIAAASGLLLGRGLTAPLRGLTDAARQLGSGNLRTRAPEDGDDEIGELGVQFNRMAAQMQESFATLESERDALRTFIADMSHEIRTPITALRTFNDLLTGGAANDEEVRDEFLSESGRQIERLEWLAQNLLDLSKFDAGLADMRVTCIDLRTVVERVVDETRLAGERKGVALSYRPPDTPIEARADPKRLEQALDNVVLNGVKYTPSGGEVTLSLAYEGSMAVIRVRDTGPGIPAEELEHVFERFYRGPSSASVTSGSGLGLAIVQSIMHAHGGDVEIQSEPGVGTEVLLTIPR